MFGHCKRYESLKRIVTQQQQTSTAELLKIALQISVVCEAFPKLLPAYRCKTQQR
jgi:hypothetical protein